MQAPHGTGVLNTIPTLAYRRHGRRYQRANGAGDTMHKPRNSQRKATLELCRRPLHPRLTGKRSAADAELQADAEEAAAEAVHDHESDEEERVEAQDAGSEDDV